MCKSLSVYHLNEQSYYHHFILSLKIYSEIRNIVLFMVQRDSGMFHDLPKVTQMESERAGIQSQVSLLPDCSQQKFLPPVSFL